MLLCTVNVAEITFVLKIPESLVQSRPRIQGEQVKGSTGKFNEYKDLKPGVVSPYNDITLKYDDEKGSHIDFESRNPGRSPALPGMAPTDD